MPKHNRNTPQKIVLAYSGGLDTSVILHWLHSTYQCEIITFTADIGQGEELTSAYKIAEAIGAKQICIENLQEEFVRDFVFPMFRANALYEGVYLLGTAIARPLIARRQIEIAVSTGADAVAHGATGKGNDQVRFELTYYALKPDIFVIAPWREWSLRSRSDMISYVKEHQIPVKHMEDTTIPYSTDANLLHVSHEGQALEDPWIEPNENIFCLTVAPELAPNQPAYIEITFSKGDAIAINDVLLSPASLLKELNNIGGCHGIGRVDLVENRCIGMKSRGVYETPGGTLLFHAHKAIESLTLDREVMHLKDELMPRYAKLVYNGLWFSPERFILQETIDATQRVVNGTARLKLYKGSVQVVGRRSHNSLYQKDYATFEKDKVYNQHDAEGFIKLNSLRLRLSKQN